MRKVIWCCAALALGASAAVYAAAEYADHFPDSALGRCVITTYRAGTVYNPVYQLSRAVVGRTFEAVQKVTDHPEVVPSTVTVIPADPQPAPAEEPACPAPSPTHDGREPGPRPCAVLGKVVIQPDDEAGEKPQTGTADGDAEQAEFVPPPMPHARDDGDVPPKMPYATDDTPDEERDAAGDINFLLRLFQEAATHCTDGGQEECEPHPAGTSDCQEDPHYDEQYPGCPAMGPCPRGGCPRAGKCPAPRHDEPVVEDKGQPPAGEADEPSEAPPEPAGPKYGPDAKGPGHRDVDTTEYRPSDGNPVDFSSYPY